MNITFEIEVEGAARDAVNHRLKEFFCNELMAEADKLADIARDNESSAKLNLFISCD